MGTAFTNDLGYHGTLVAVTASSNRSKGDEDPTEWKPPTEGFWCDDATWGTTVEVNWSLNDGRVELLNGGGSTAALVGWRIHDEGPNFISTFPSFTLAAGGRSSCTPARARTAPRISPGARAATCGTTPAPRTPPFLDSNGADDPQQEQP